MKRLIKRFDTRVTKLVQSRPAWFQPIMTSATFLGEPIVIVNVAVYAMLVAHRQNQTSVIWAFLATLAATGFNGLLKVFLHRPRPDTLYVGMMKYKTYSFPSGHAFGSVVIYGLLAYLTYNSLPQLWDLVVASLMGLVIAIIGISRIYLGAHWPSDVLAGWLLGGGFLYLIIKLAAI